jgi:hypothetical protein
MPYTMHPAHLLLLLLQQAAASHKACHALLLTLLMRCTVLATTSCRLQTSTLLLLLPLLVFSLRSLLQAMMPAFLSAVAMCLIKSTTRQAAGR